MEQQEKKKTIRTFGVASFLNDFGSDIIYPIWPLFLTSVMGANMAMLGFIDGMGDAVVAVSQAISGYYSDKYKKKKIFVWVGYLLGATSRIGYAVSTGWAMIIPFRILDRAGKIRSAPRDAIIANISEEHERGRNFGYLRGLDNLGAVCGVITCMLLMNFDYRYIFIIAAIPSIIGSLLIVRGIKEPTNQPASIFKGISFRHLDNNIAALFILNAIFALGSFSYSFLLLYSQEYIPQATALPVFYLIFTVVAAVSSLPFGKLSDRIGRKPVLLLSFVFWGCTCAGFLFLTSTIGIVFCFILFGLHKAALEPVQKALVSELAPPELRASVLGGFQMMIGLCALPASFLAGILWENINPSSPLYVSWCFTLIAIILLFFVKTKHTVQAR